MDGDDKLLADVLRTFLRDRSGYCSIADDSVCLDGWANDLTPEHVAAVRRANLEENPRTVQPPVFVIRCGAGFPGNPTISCQLEKGHAGDHKGPVVHPF